MVLKAVKNLIETSLNRSGAQHEPIDRAHAVRLATAALLVEMERADFEEGSAERTASEAALRKHFDLDDSETQLLLESASEQADTAVSLHEFTRLLHEELSEEEKHAVIEMLWRVAFADERLDKHEDYLVRKVAELLYVRNIDVMRLKWKVQKG